MDSKRKKELIEEYKCSKSEMGVYQIRNTVNGKTYIGITQNLKGVMNGNLFKLGVGAFRIKELQQEWNYFGSDKFEQTILAELSYDKDETKLDYTEDLLALRDMVTEAVDNKIYI